MGCCLRIGWISEYGRFISFIKDLAGSILVGLLLSALLWRISLALGPLRSAGRISVCGVLGCGIFFMLILSILNLFRGTF